MPRLGRGATLATLAAANVAMLVAWQWTVLTRLGPGTPLDALVAGMVLPNFVAAVAGGALANVLLPMLSALPPDGRRAARSDLSGTLLALFGGAAAVLAVLAPVWVVAIAPGVTATARPLVTALARLQLVSVALTGVLAVQAVSRQAAGEFVRVEAAQLAASAAALALLPWAIPRFGAGGVAASVVLRTALQLVFILPAGDPARWRVRRAGVVSEAWGRVRPLVGSALYYKSDAVLDRALASLAPAGSLGLYHMAQQGIAAGQQVMQRALVAPGVRRMARDHATREPGALARTVAGVLLVAGGLVGAVTLVLALAGEPILQAVLGHGAMTAPQVRVLWQLLLLLTGVWVGGVLGLVLASSFYTLGDTRTPTRIGIVGFTVAIGIKLLAFRAFGLPGLAAAASAYYVMNMLALGAALRRRLAPVGDPT